MNTASKILPSVQAEFAILYVALELSKKKWLAGFLHPQTGKISRQSFAGGDWKGLLAQIAKARSKAEASLQRPVKVVSCYEAGYDGFWLDRRLMANDIENYVIDAASIEVDRRARRVKTDPIDLHKLLRVLQALIRGEKGACRVVRVPRVEDEDRRRRSRERERLVKEKTAHLNRIKGLLMNQGVRYFRPERSDWQGRLEELESGDGRPLLPCLKDEIRREILRLHQVILMIKEIEAKEREEALADEKSSIALLLKLRGVGIVGATTLGYEVFFRDFRNRRQVGAYLGFDDSRWQSGGMDRGQGISKAGNPRARALLIELAWLWLRHQPESALSRWFKAHVGQNKGRIRRTGIVALARKLAIALWRYVSTGVVPEGALFKA